MNVAIVSAHCGCERNSTRMGLCQRCGENMVEYEHKGRDPSHIEAIVWNPDSLKSSHMKVQ